MGNKQTHSLRQRVTSTTTTDATSTNPFKLFEYQCTTCSAKRPIQYFYRNGVFLPQTPRVVCGECNTSSIVEPFKTVDYSCPWCKKCHKARLPAKPISINMYNVSVASCNCGFRGEVPVGRLMDVSCTQCWNHKREMRDVWTEDGDELRVYCEHCQDYQRAFARVPQKKRPQAEKEQADMEFKCENCHCTRPIDAEEVLRNGGLAFCSLCGWVGYPEVTPAGQQAQAQRQSGGDANNRSNSAAGTTRAHSGIRAPLKGLRGEKPPRSGSKERTAAKRQPGKPSSEIAWQSPVPAAGA